MQDPEKSNNAFGFAEFYNNPSVPTNAFLKKGGHSLEQGTPQNAADNTKQEQSVGPINIVTGNSKVDFIGRKSTQATALTSKQGQAAQEKPNIVDINNTTLFPGTTGRKKNKNDFYRFLLQQNLSSEMIGNPSILQAINSKVNNDILIPRSILKKNNVGPKREA